MLSGEILGLLGPNGAAGSVRCPNCRTCMDGFTGALYLDETGEVRRSARAFGGIWDVCLDETGSRDLIHYAAEGMSA